MTWLGVGIVGLVACAAGCNSRVALGDPQPNAAAACAPALAVPVVVAPRPSIAAPTRGPDGLYFASAQGIEKVTSGGVQTVLSAQGLSAAIGTATVDAMSVTGEGRILFGANRFTADPPGESGILFLYDPATDEPPRAIQRFDGARVRALLSTDGGTFIGIGDPTSVPFGADVTLYRFDHGQEQIETVVTLRHSGVVHGLTALDSGALLVAHGYASDPHGRWRLDVPGQQLELVADSSWPVRLDARGDGAVWATTDPDEGFEGGWIFAGRPGDAARLVVAPEPSDAESHQDPRIYSLAHGGDVVYAGRSDRVTVHCLTGDGFAETHLGRIDSLVTAGGGLYAVTHGEDGDALVFVGRER